MIVLRVNSRRRGLRYPHIDHHRSNCVYSSAFEFNISKQGGIKGLEKKVMCNGEQNYLMDIIWLTRK